MKIAGSSVGLLIVVCFGSRGKIKKGTRRKDKGSEGKIKKEGRDSREGKRTRVKVRIGMGSSF